MEKRSGKMIINKKGFIDIDLPNSFQENNGWWHFNKGDVRNNLEEIFVDNANYSLLRVFANPLVVSRREDSKGKILIFDYQLKDEYISVLNKLGEKFIGKSSFISFDSVEESNEGGWPRPESVNFPVNYIIKEVYSGVFKSLVDSLNDDEAYNILKEMEHPQNYNINRINILRVRKVNPLVLGKDEFIIDSKNLKNAVNFLIPFGLKYESDDHSHNVD